jgi:capsular exopolysaccharide synthesis family protein
VESAAQPLKPASSQKLRFTLVAAMLGFLLASGVVFLIEYLDDTLENVEDILQSLSLPTLTIVPRSGGRRKRKRALLVIHDPDSPGTEAYRVLRTHLQLSHPGGSLHTLLITAPLSRQEKANVVTNLGAVIAQAGLEVLIVDADLRQSQLHKSFDLAREPGLSGLLAETSNDRAYVTETDISNLRFLSGGSTPPDPLQLLSSPRMTWFIAELKKQADIVLFNAPPVLCAADAVVLAAQMDGTVLVIESQSTRRQSAAQALKMLRNVEANVLGVVLTKVRCTSSGYRYYSDFEKPERASHAFPSRNHDGLVQTGGTILPLSEPVSDALDSSDRV